ncbi:hypothetical protein BD410DRAFT_827018 [Rickenella mellea]|uniref:Uncharacterized protein n=1 Tax=Rickenella mellea TaxID=50990 RepID=A0A4Y7QA64_9AGAM|nr:hypothetical protein BD410DRAFT_827018 [Rickenella mellea]
MSSISSGVMDNGDSPKLEKVIYAEFLGSVWGREDPASDSDVGGCSSATEKATKGPINANRRFRSSGETGIDMKGYREEGGTVSSFAHPVFRYRVAYARCHQQSQQEGQVVKSNVDAMPGLLQRGRDAYMGAYMKHKVSTWTLRRMERSECDLLFQALLGSICGDDPQ